MPLPCVMPARMSKLVIAVAMTAMIASFCSASRFFGDHPISSATGARRLQLYKSRESQSDLEVSGLIADLPAGETGYVHSADLFTLPQTTVEELGEVDSSDQSGRRIASGRTAPNNRASPSPNRIACAVIMKGSMVVENPAVIGQHSAGAQLSSPPTFSTTYAIRQASIQMPKCRAILSTPRQRLLLLQLISGPSLTRLPAPAINSRS